MYYIVFNKKKIGIFLGIPNQEKEKAKTWCQQGKNLTPRKGHYSTDHLSTIWLVWPTETVTGQWCAEPQRDRNYLVMHTFSLPFKHNSQALLLHFQKTQVWFPTPTSGSSQWPRTPPAGDTAPSSDLHRHSHTLYIHTQRHKHIWIIQNWKINLKIR